MSQITYGLTMRLWRFFFASFFDENPRSPRS